MVFYIVFDDKRLTFERLDDLVEALERGYRVEFVTSQRYSKVIYRVDLVNNLLNHVMVAADLNYTYGYPVDRLRCISIDEAYRLYRTGLRKTAPFIAQSILRSSPLSLEELYDALYELIDFANGAGTNKLKPAYTWSEVEELNKYYSDTLELFRDMVKPVNSESIEHLIKCIQRCYENHYADHWEMVRDRLRELSVLAEKFNTLTKPYELLVELTGVKPGFTEIEAYMIDVFRRGGGVFSTMPNRVAVTTDPSTIPTHYTGLVHEAGHLLIRGWEIKLYDVIKELCVRIGVKPSIKIPFILEEIFMALLQKLSDEKILGYSRATHGLMNTLLFRVAYRVYRELERNDVINYYSFMERFVEEIPRDKHLVEELLALINTLFPS